MVSFIPLPGSACMRSGKIFARVSRTREDTDEKVEMPSMIEIKSSLVTPTPSSFATAVAGVRGGLRGNEEF